MIFQIIAIGIVLTFLTFALAGLWIVFGLFVEYVTKIGGK